MRRVDELAVSRGRQAEIDGQEDGAGAKDGETTDHGVDGSGQGHDHDLASPDPLLDEKRGQAAGSIPKFTERDPGLRVDQREPVGLARGNHPEQAVEGLAGGERGVGHRGER